MTAAPDFRSLNDAERRILALLAQGHTAKSIAVEVGRSEAAVNERLREARRKTGVGSSRELARLLSAQEDRDEEIGMASEAGIAPAPASAPRPARWQRKVLLMTIIPVALAATVLALHGSGRQTMPVPPMPPAPPGVVPATGGDADAARLRATFVEEARDPTWGDGATAVLERRYHVIGGADLATLSIVCHTTLCEVRGQAMSDVKTGAGKRLSDALASPTLRSSVPGLHADVTDVSSFTRGSSYVISFDAIWRRTSG